MEKNEEKKTIAEFHPDAAAIYARLKTASVGDLIPYGELGEIIGVKDITQHWTRVASARRRAIREDQIVFECVRKEGLRRMSDEQIALTGQNAVRHVGRSAYRAMQKLACVGDFAKMSGAAQIAHNTSMSLLTVFRRISGKHTVEKVEAAVSERKAAIPNARLLELFK